VQRERANIAAVGSFEPGIELWDMDVVDAVEPLATLGGADYAAARAAAATAAAAATEGGGGKKKKGSKKKKKGSGPEVPVKPGSHEDAVLGLAWNPAYRNVLASASGEQEPIPALHCMRRHPPSGAATPALRCAVLCCAVPFRAALTLPPL
jgi:periodic tryptophan protein 1